MVLLCRHDRAQEVDGVTIKPLRLSRNRLGRMTLGLARTYASARSESASLYHLHDPELLVIAPLLKRKGTVVFDAHEDLPAQILNKPWLPRLLRRPLASIARRAIPLLLRSVDAVAAATPAIAKTVTSRPVEVVQNYPRLDSRSTGRAFAERDRSVAYIGAMNEIRGAVQMVEALGLLPPDPPITLQFAGIFEPPHLQARLSSLSGWDRVHIAGWLSQTAVADLLAGCRAGLVTLLPAPNFLSSQPIKLFEYMAAGLPVIASDFPLWREIVETNRCGVVVDPRDPRAIADAIQLVTSDDPEVEEMGRRGRDAVERIYNWGTQEPVLLDLYEGLSCASGS